MDRSVHMVVFKGEHPTASKVKVKKLMDKDIIPFPEAFEYLDFFYNTSLHTPVSNTIENLKKLIDLRKDDLGEIEKIAYITKYMVLQSLQFRTPATMFRLAEYLSEILDFCAISIDRSIHYLQNDLVSKEVQLEKRREKRKRYSENKNARRLHSYRTAN